MSIQPALFPLPGADPATAAVVASTRETGTEGGYVDLDAGTAMRDFAMSLDI
jgi:hypothetical protein